MHVTPSLRQEKVWDGQDGLTGGGGGEGAQVLVASPWS